MREPEERRLRRECTVPNCTKRSTRNWDWTRRELRRLEEGRNSEWFDADHRAGNRAGSAKVVDGTKGENRRWN